MKKQTLGQAIKSDFKQGLGDAADTLLRAPARIAGAMGLKQSQGNRSPNNKGEQAAKELFGRGKAAAKAFSAPAQIAKVAGKAPTAARKAALKK